MKRYEAIDKELFRKRDGSRKKRQQKRVAQEKKLTSRALRHERKRQEPDEQGVIEKPPRRGWEY